ncbi:MAG: flagellar hook assembly protein FlgD [Candidatus Krumholzibacteriia bacterium]
MPIQGITDGTGTVVGQPERDYSQISEIDFMTLLVAQIKNQDPMSPMDNAEFTGQITQFTMLDELETMNAKLDDSILVGQSINNTGMLALVGKDVTVQGDGVTLAEGAASQSLVTCEGVGTATVEVKNSAGQVVATYTAPVNPGMSDISWDGKLEDGSVAPDGDYSLEVRVNNSNGEDLPFTPLMTGRVEGLRYENNIGVVVVGGAEYYVSEIYKVS